MYDSRGWSQARAEKQEGLTLGLRQPVYRNLFIFLNMNSETLNLMWKDRMSSVTSDTLGYIDKAMCCMPIQGALTSEQGAICNAGVY